VAAGGHLAFLHGLQECGLGLGRRAVDLVGQEDVGEDRPLLELEAAASALGLFLEDVGAGDIRGIRSGVNWMR